MFLIVFIIKLISRCQAIDVDLAPLEKYLSTDTYAAFNMSKEYKPFNITDFEKLNTLTRREHIFRWYHWIPNHYYNWELIGRNCYITAQTFQGAYDEIRLYYQIRFLYVNNIQYEVGYLIHEIVHRYQMMLEIYQMLERKFYYSQERYFTPVAYMLYMYSTVLEYSMTIVHLVNMLHELDKKYLHKEKKSVFDNLFDPKSTRARGHKTNATAIDGFEGGGQFNFQQRLAAAKKAKKKELAKARLISIMSGDWKLTTVDRRPKKSHIWPLDYGWSIEYW